MKHLFSLLLFLTVALNCLARISGKVVDSQNDMPLVGASVQAFGIDSLYIGGAVTGPEGEFSIADDSLLITLIKISYIGYDPTAVEIPAERDLGLIRLQPSGVILSSVTVTGDSRPQDATTETYFLSDSIRASANNAAMMIGNLPGFKVDWISENISIGADKNVPIIVNGREVGFQYAKSINPKRIKNVQVQRFPPGQYSDYPVLINIELFENYIGWDVSGNATGKLSLRNKHSNSETIAADATLSTTDWNTYLSASYAKKQSYDASSFLRDISGTYVEESMPIDRDNPNIRVFSDEYSLSAGADRKLGDKHKLSLQTWLEHADSDGKDFYDMTGGNRLTNTDNYRSLNSITGLFYRGSFGDKLQLSSTLLYNYYDIDEDRNYTEGSQASASHVNGRKDYMYISTDGTYSINDRWEATIGYNYTWRKYNSVENDSPLSFTSMENRHKVDATISYSPSNRFDLRVGGSMLDIHNRQNGIGDHHTSWMPRLQLYWRPFNRARLTAIYLNEINYPNLDQLSTSSWYISSHIVQTGNPDLRSRIVHYANVRLTLLDCLTLQYMWRKSNNDIVEWYEVMSTEKVKKTFINCDYLHQYAGLSVDKYLGKGVNINFTGNYQWYKRWSAGELNNGRTWYGDLTATWTIGNTNLTLLGEYFIRHDKEPLPQGMKYNEQEMLAVGFNYPLCKGRLSLSAILSIPVDLIDKRPYTKINIPGFKSEIYADDRINSFLAQLNIRYTIGNGKVRKSSNTYVTDTEK